MTADQSTDREKRYWAFISYSHEDTAWVVRFHKRLETFHVPRNFVGCSTSLGMIPSRLFPVYRDRDETSGGSDINRVIQTALAQSRFLIVICSPASATSKFVNEEIRHFKLLGRSERVVYLVITGQPSCGPVEEMHALPAAVRIRFEPDGSVADDAPLPVCIDARRGKDGPNDAFLKVVAQLLQVKFDDLRRREIRRRRYRRRFTAILLVISAVILLSIFGGLADRGASIPGANWVRRNLDRYGYSFFRPIPGEPACQAIAAAKRRAVETVLLAELREGKWGTAHSGSTQPTRLDVWTAAQVTTALLETLDMTDADARACADVLAPAFDPSQHVDNTGHHFGWIPLHSTCTQVEPALWMVSAVADLLGRKGFLSQEDQLCWQERLDYAQTAAEEYYRGDGAWYAVTGRRPPDSPSVYSSVLALRALLETYRNGLSWHGSAIRRDELTSQTAQWLIKNFHGDCDPPGWFATPNTNRRIAIDGLTLQAFSVLLRARDEAGVVLPTDIQWAIRSYLLSLETRDERYPSVTIRPAFDFEDYRGRPRSETIAIRCLWRPWAISAAYRWLHSSGEQQASAEDRNRVRRILGALLTDPPAAPYRPEKRASYVIAEDLFGFLSLDSRRH
jgi:hypothetical protein